MKKSQSHLLCFLKDFCSFFCYLFNDEPGSSPEGDVDHDAGPKTQVPRFLPERTPGPNLPDFQTRQNISKFLRPVDFFRLFFTVDIVQKMCGWTDDYADSVGEQRKSLNARWTNFIDLLVC